MTKAGERLIVATEEARKVARGAAFVVTKQHSMKPIYKRVVVRCEDIEDAIEDAELNAIANERAKGPFVRVSLDDL